MDMCAYCYKACGSWKLDNGDVIQDGCQQLSDLLKNGFVPVLHGDCVLDLTHGCKVLSGDTIIQVIIGEAVSSIYMYEVRCQFLVCHIQDFYMTRLIPFPSSLVTSISLPHLNSVSVLLDRFFVKNYILIRYFSFLMCWEFIAKPPSESGAFSRF